MKHDQLSFDLINSNEPNLDELAALENPMILDFISDTAKWPENKVLLFGSELSGCQSLAKNFEGNGKIIYDITDFANIDESSLFAKIIDAEANKIFLLIIANKSPKELKINSPDLKSRIDGIMCLNTKSANIDILSRIFANWAEKYGYIFKKNDIILLLSSLKIDFVINYKLIEYIKKNYSIGTKFSKSEIDKIIKNFEEYILGQSLLDGYR